MHMGASLDGRYDWHADLGYVLENLNAFIVNLAPYSGIRYVAERWPLDTSNEVSTCASQVHDFVRPILRNPVKGVDKLRVILRRKSERAAVAVKFGNEEPLASRVSFRLR